MAIIMMIIIFCATPIFLFKRCQKVDGLCILKSYILMHCMPRWRRWTLKSIYFFKGELLYSTQEMGSPMQ